jgi:hypothetical protein
LGCSGAEEGKGEQQEDRDGVVVGLLLFVLEKRKGKEKKRGIEGEGEILSFLYWKTDTHPRYIGEAVAARAVGREPGESDHREHGRCGIPGQSSRE